MIKGKKRGRKRGRKVKGYIPQNYNFWLFTSQNKKETDDFLNRAKQHRLEEFGQALRHMRTANPEVFKKVNGNDILKRINK